MTPEYHKIISGALTFGGFAGLLYILHWQIRIWPRDRLMASIMTFILTLGAMLGQLCMSYLGGPKMGDGLRGNLSYGLVMLSIIWMAFELRRHNLRFIRASDDPPRNEPRLL